MGSIARQRIVMHRIDAINRIDPRAVSSRCLRHSLEHAIHRLPERLGTRRRTGNLGHDNDVLALQSRLSVAEGLSDDALDPVSDHGTARHALGDREP